MRWLVRPVLMGLVLAVGLTVTPTAAFPTPNRPAVTAVTANSGTSISGTFTVTGIRRNMSFDVWLGQGGAPIDERGRTTTFFRLGQSVDAVADQTTYTYEFTTTALQQCDSVAANVNNLYVQVAIVGHGFKPIAVSNLAGPVTWSQP